MAGKATGMGKRREILRLKNLGLTERAIARALSCSRHTVKKYLDESLNPAQSVPELLLKSDMSDDRAVVEALGWVEKVDWGRIEKEILKGVPALVLWQEEAEAGRVLVQYPGFWKQLRKKLPNLPEATMHRVFAPGARAEIDYADGIEILDPSTGEIVKTQFFVGVLCHSRFLFAEFTLSQKSHDFLSSHVRMFEAWGGVPHVLSPDNLKSAVTKTHRYDPEINQAYTRLAEHYHFAVVPARVATPQDKAVVERTIQIFQRWFFFRVRHRTFTSLVELNQILKEHIDLFHQRNHRILRRSRKAMFEDERTHLQALPEQRYEVMTMRRATPHPDCHLVFEKNYYSAPHKLRGQECEVWASATTVEICHNGVRVAFHCRSKTEGKFITDTSHYPPEHQAFAEATPAYLRSQAEKIGPESTALVVALFSLSHPLRHLRRAQGMLRLAHIYGNEAFETAAAQANRFHQLTYPFLENQLKRGARQVQKVVPITRGENPFLRKEGLFDGYRDEGSSSQNAVQTPGR